MSELAISPSYLKDDFPFLFICGPYILFPANIDLISTYIFFPSQSFYPMVMYDAYYVRIDPYI
jgi:hypothetical protein